MSQLFILNVEVIYPFCPAIVNVCRPRLRLGQITQGLLISFFNFITVQTNNPHLKRPPRFLESRLFYKILNLKEFITVGTVNDCFILHVKHKISDFFDFQIDWKRPFLVYLI